MASDFIIKAKEFLLKIYENLENTDYNPNLVKRAGDWQVQVHSNYVKVEYIEPEEAGRGVEKLSKFPLEDIILVEQAVFGKSKLKKLKKEMICLEQ